MSPQKNGQFIQRAISKQFTYVHPQTMLIWCVSIWNHALLWDSVRKCAQIKKKEFRGKSPEIFCKNWRRKKKRVFRSLFECVIFHQFWFPLLTMYIMQQSCYDINTNFFLYVAYPFRFTKYIFGCNTFFPFTWKNTMNKLEQTTIVLNVKKSVLVAWCGHFNFIFLGQI